MTIRDIRHQPVSGFIKAESQVVFNQTRIARQLVANAILAAVWRNRTDLVCYRIHGADSSGRYIQAEAIWNLSTAIEDEGFKAGALVYERYLIDLEAEPRDGVLLEERGLAEAPAFDADEEAEPCE